MYRLLLVALVGTLFLNQPLQAEDKNGIIDEHNKTSSSFVVDPDPLDPLPLKRENIKDGDEIILDDIRQVLDSKKPETSSATSGAAQVSKGKSKARKSKKNKTVYENLNPDDPDLRLENRLHSVYQKFNITPTSPEEWSQATTGQKENIYVVQKNDTLFTISRTLFGDSKFWPKIWALNRNNILNPHQILPGMRIHFFAGDADNFPTVSLDPKDKYFVQDTEFQRVDRPSGKTDKSHYPTSIPDSLPLTRNGKYYAPAEGENQIDIKAFEYIEDYQHSNPFILSNKELRSEFVVPISQIPNLVCKDNQFVPVVTKENKEAMAGKYLLVKELLRDKKRLKTTRKYKITGDVTVNEQNQMRVSNCKDLMDLDTFIVSEEKIRALSDPDEAFNFSARIVDGLDYQSQDYYTDNQYLVINLDGLNVDTGADLNIVSDDLGKKVGTLRILRRQGTMAVAVITHTYDIINRGDKITE